MKVVFINRFFHPDHSATGQMLSDLAFGLADRGTKVEVICSRLRYDRPQCTLPATEEIRGVRVNRVASSTFGRGKLPGRALDYATFFVSAAACLNKLLLPGDIAVAMTDPPMISTAVAGVARRRGAVLVNWLQDVFPEIAQRARIPGMRGPVAAALRLLRKRALERCHRRAHGAHPDRLWSGSARNRDRNTELGRRPRDRTARTQRQSATTYLGAE